MKKFLLTLAAVALATSAMMAQTNVNTGTVEEPDRVQLKSTMSKNPTGTDIATGMAPQQQIQKQECKDHKDGKPCTKPADQQCPDCKEKAANAPKHDCKKGEGHECKEGMKPECKDGKMPECKEGMKDCKKGEGHECKKGEGPKHECKEGMKDCKKGDAPKLESKKAEGRPEKAVGPKLQRKDGQMELRKGEAPKHECKEGHEKECEKAEMLKKHEECKDHKDGKPCTKPADQQCPDCKEKAAKKN